MHARYNNLSLAPSGVCGWVGGTKSLNSKSMEKKGLPHQGTTQIQLSVTFTNFIHSRFYSSPPSNLATFPTPSLKKTQARSLPGHSPHLSLLPPPCGQARRLVPCWPRQPFCCNVVREKNRDHQTAVHCPRLPRRSDTWRRTASLSAATPSSRGRAPSQCGRTFSNQVVPTPNSYVDVALTAADVRMMMEEG